MDEVARGIDFYNQFRGNTAKSNEWFTGVFKTANCENVNHDRLSKNPNVTKHLLRSDSPMF